MSVRHTQLKEVNVIQKGGNITNNLLSLTRIFLFRFALAANALVPCWKNGNNGIVCNSLRSHC